MTRNGDDAWKGKNNHGFESVKRHAKVTRRKKYDACPTLTLKTATRTVSVTFWQRSRLWSPSQSTSGSTIGTRPAAWQIEANLITKPFSNVVFSLGVSLVVPGQNIGILHDGLRAGRVGSNFQDAAPLGKPGTFRLWQKCYKLFF